MKREYLFNLHTHMFDGEGGEAGASEAASTETVVYGKSEDVAAESQVGADTEGSENTPDLKAEFDSLIQGQFKGEFDAAVNKAVQQIVGQRFKNSENYQETIERYEKALAPTYAMYGLKPGDVDGLGSALEADESLYAHRADQEGVTPQQFRENLRLRMEAEQGRALKELVEQEKNKRETFAKWDRQAAELKAVAPNFDLEQELQNPEFVEALNRVNSVKEAFFIAHMDELLSGAQAEAKADATNQFVENFKARQSRPSENAGSTTPATVRKADPSKWTDEDMDEVERRVAAGERIVL